MLWAFALVLPLFLALPLLLAQQQTPRPNPIHFTNHQTTNSQQKNYVFCFLLENNYQLVKKYIPTDQPSYQLPAGSNWAEESQQRGSTPSTF